MLKMTESSNWGGKGAGRRERGEEAGSRRKTSGRGRRQSKMKHFWINLVKKGGKYYLS